MTSSFTMQHRKECGNEIGVSSRARLLLLALWSLLAIVVQEVEALEEGRSALQALSSEGQDSVSTDYEDSVSIDYASSAEDSSPRVYRLVAASWRGTELGQLWPILREITQARGASGAFDLTLILGETVMPDVKALKKEFEEQLGGVVAEERFRMLSYRGGSEEPSMPDALRPGTATWLRQSGALKRLEAADYLIADSMCNLRAFAHQNLQDTPVSVWYGTEFLVRSFPANQFSQRSEQLQLAPGIAKIPSSYSAVLWTSPEHLASSGILPEAKGVLHAPSLLDRKAQDNNDREEEGKPFFETQYHSSFSAGPEMIFVNGAVTPEPITLNSKKRPLLSASPSLPAASRRVADYMESDQQKTLVYIALGSINRVTVTGLRRLLTEQLSDLIGDDRFVILMRLSVAANDEGIPYHPEMLSSDDVDSLLYDPESGILTTDERFKGRNSDNLVFSLGMLPQKDIFAAYAERMVFVSGCGVSSITEGLAAGIPMVMVPAIREQSNNAHNMETAGVAVDLSDLSEEMVRERQYFHKVSYMTDNGPQLTRHRKISRAPALVAARKSIQNAVAYLLQRRTCQPSGTACETSRFAVSLREALGLIRKNTWDYKQAAGIIWESLRTANHNLEPADEIYDSAPGSHGVQGAASAPEPSRRNLHVIHNRRLRAPVSALKFEFFCRLVLYCWFLVFLYCCSYLLRIRKKSDDQRTMIREILVRDSRESARSCEIDDEGEGTP